jgi:hypothetical protein
MIWRYYSCYVELVLIMIAKSLKWCCFKKHEILCKCGPSSVVGIVTANGLDGPGIESQWGRDFPHLSRPALRPTQPPVQWVFTRGKVRLGRDADPSPPSSAEVKNRVELYLYSP